VFQVIKLHAVVLDTQARRDSRRSDASPGALVQALSTKTNQARTKSHPAVACEKTLAAYEAMWQPRLSLPAKLACLRYDATTSDRKYGLNFRHQHLSALLQLLQAN
jgi:hypothetical protein